MKLTLPPLVLPPPSSSETPPPPPPASRLILPCQPFPKEDDHIRGISKRLASGYAETTGVRKSMEDRMTIFGSFRYRDDEDYFAVFDGHNGDASAKYCAGRMHDRLSELFERESDPVRCFKAAFELTNEGLEKVPSAGGTTAVVALFKGDHLYVANTGDSRAVLSKDNKATRVTTDHKPDLPAEKERIEKSGGWVKNGGITGTLTVSRALGDFSYKPYVTCEPDVFGPYVVHDETYQLLILACDGLWDVVSDDEAVAIALTAKNPEEAAVRLRDKAFLGKSQDNISVMVVFFPHYGPSEVFSQKMEEEGNHVETPVTVGETPVEATPPPSVSSEGKRRMRKSHKKRGTDKKHVKKSSEPVVPPSATTGVDKNGSPAAGPVPLKKRTKAGSVSMSTLHVNNKTENNNSASEKKDPKTISSSKKKSATKTGTNGGGGVEEPPAPKGNNEGVGGGEEKKVVSSGKEEVKGVEGGGDVPKKQRKNKTEKEVGEKKE